MPRLRQAVLAATDLDATAGWLREELGLGEPYADPGVAHFGLRNAVFALGDTFLEVVSPVRSDAPAARLIERRGGDCGYMLMFQVEDFEGSRARARALGIREVFEVALEDMMEVHLHPADMRAAIVSLSAPHPPESWRWGGPNWQARSAPVKLAGATVAVADPRTVQARWHEVIGELPGIAFASDPQERGPVELTLAGARPHSPFTIAGVRFAFATPAAAAATPSRKGAEP